MTNEAFGGVNVVAIDGPAGSGKSSVSKEIARRNGFGYLDTGAAYRALSWHVLTSGADTTDEAAVLAALGSFDLRQSFDPDDRAVFVGDADVTDAIRTPEVTGAIAGFTRVQAVRDALNDGFRARAAASGLPGVVIEGRDITSVVAPDAPVRILLTARPEVRAQRRGLELSTAAGDVADAINRRDASDAHTLSLAEGDQGVDVVDTSELDFEQSVAAVQAVIEQRTGGRDGR